MTILDELARLPDGWGFVAVDGEKRPYQKAWQDNQLTKAKLAKELKAGRAPCYWRLLWRPIRWAVVP